MNRALRSLGNRNNNSVEKNEVKLLLVLTTEGQLRKEMKN